MIARCRPYIEDMYYDRILCGIRTHGAHRAGYRHRQGACVLCRWDMEKTFENGNPAGFVIPQKDQAEIYLTLKQDHAASDRNVLHAL